MAFNLGSMTKYDDANSAAHPTILVAAKGIKLQPFKGAFFQAMSAPLALLKTKDFEVYNRSKTTKGGTITEPLDNSATTVTLDTTSITGITVGDIIKIDSELMWVKSITDRSAGTIVVQRGVGTSTADSHLDNAAYTYYYSAINSSDLKNVESAYENTAKYTNYVQTIVETIDWELELELLMTKGITPEQANLLLIEEATTRFIEKLARVAILGQKMVGGKSGAPYMTDGLLNQLIDTNGATRPTQTYDCSGAFTETKFRAALKQVMLVPGAMPNVAWMDSVNKETINGLLKSMTIVNDLNKNTAGYSIDYYNYEGNIIEVRVDADMPTDQIAIVNQSKCYYKWLDGDAVRLVDEPAQSSREKRKSIQGSIGFAIEDVGYEHILMTGITH